MTFQTACVHGMSAETYHSDPVPISLSSSIAHLLVNFCPRIAHHRHPRLGGAPSPTSDEFDRGSIVHELILGTGKGITEIDAPDWRTKAAKAARDQARAQGLVPILAHKARELRYTVDAINDQLTDLGITFEGSSRETVLLWTETADDGTVIQCRGMVDALWRNGYRIIDLKTADCAKPKDVTRSCINYGYDIQHAAYTSAMRAVWPESAGRERMLFVFAECGEKGAPSIVTPAELDGSLRELGERKWRRAINTWAECMRTDKWPGYVTGTAYLSAPQWAVEEFGE